jgi:hypothetical protein
MFHSGYERVRRVVMVPERGIKLHARIEECLVRQGELLHEVRRPLAAVDVIAEHDDAVEGELRVKRHHLLRDLILLRIARAGIADDGELHRAGRVWERELLRRHPAQRGTDDEQRDEEKTRGSWRGSVGGESHD